MRASVSVSAFCQRFAVGARLAFSCKTLFFLTLYRDRPGVFRVCTASRAAIVTGLRPALLALVRLSLLQAVFSLREGFGKRTGLRGKPRAICTALRAS